MHACISFYKFLTVHKKYHLKGIYVSYIYMYLNLLCLHVELIGICILLTIGYL